MKPIMDSSIVTHEVAISEHDLRDRMAMEVLASLGLLDAEGQPRPGVSHTVLRGENRRGGYRVRITRDMSQDTTPRITGPEASA